MNLLLYYYAYKVRLGLILYSLYILSSFILIVELYNNYLYEFSHSWEFSI